MTQTTTPKKDTRWKKGQSGNLKGRPKGTRNRATLQRAQLTVDNAMLDMVEFFQAVMRRDAKKLQRFGLTPDDITVKQMAEAAKELRLMGWSKNQVLEEPDQKSGKAEEPKARFSPVAESSVTHLKKVNQ